MDPFSLASGGPMNLSGGAGGAAGDVTTNTKSSFDNSGWAVSFGSGDATTAGKLNYWLIGGLVFAGLVAWKMSKSK